MLEWLNTDILSERLAIASFALALHLVLYGVAAWLTSQSHIRLPLFEYSLWQQPWMPFTAFYTKAEDKLNRSDRATAKRAWRGGVLLFFTFLFGWVCAAGLTHLALLLPQGQEWVILIIAISLPIGPLAVSTAPALKEAWIKEARPALFAMLGCDQDMPDQHASYRVILMLMARTQMETLGLLFGFVLAEFQGLITLALLCIVYRIAARPTLRYQAFGIIIRLFYELLFFVPAMVTLLCMSLAALFTPSGNPFAILMPSERTSYTKGEDTLPYPLFLFQAYAKLLRVGLGGPYPVDGTVISQPWIGRDSAQIGAAHFRRALIHSLSYIVLLWLGLSGLSMI